MQEKPKYRSLPIYIDTYEEIRKIAFENRMTKVKVVKKAIELLLDSSKKTA